MQLKNFKYCFKHLPIADATMISATSPMFTVFFARLFIKEPIFKVDLLNFVLVFAGKSVFLYLTATPTMIFFIFVGIIMICKPPFIFGWTDLYTTDPQAKWAVLALILSSIFIQSNIFVIMRRLKGKNFVLVHNSLGVFKCPKVQMRLM